MILSTEEAAILRDHLESIDGPAILIIGIEGGEVHLTRGEDGNVGIERKAGDTTASETHSSTDKFLRAYMLEKVQVEAEE